MIFVRIVLMKFLKNTIRLSEKMKLYIKKFYSIMGKSSTLAELLADRNNIPMIFVKLNLIFSTRDYYTHCLSLLICSSHVESVVLMSRVQK